MNKAKSAWLALPAVPVGALVALAGPAPVRADTGPYGPDTCVQGYV